MALAAKKSVEQLPPIPDEFEEPSVPMKKQLRGRSPR